MFKPDSSESLFIPPGTDLNQPDDRELKRFATLPKEALKRRWNTPEGKAILSKWKESKFDRDSLDSLVGRYYGHTDLRGIPLKGANLQRTDLSSIDFYASDLRDADLSYSNLSDSWLSESDIRGTRFDWAKMDGVLLDNVNFSNSTSFVGVNLNAINFTLAALLQELAIEQQSG